MFCHNENVGWLPHSDVMRIVMSRLSFLFLLLFWLLLSGRQAVFAQYNDEVIKRGSTTGSRITIRCQIVDYNGRHLTARTRTGEKLLRIDSSEVITIRTAQTEPHKIGIKAFDEGRTRESETQLTEAIKVEPRAWMRRQILTLLVRCALKRNDRLTASTRFRLLFESDSETPHVNLIPLIWTGSTAEEEARAAAVAWLKDPEPVARLLGASLLLLDSGHSEAALKVLTELVRTPGERIRQLASWQRRRLRIRSRDVTDFDLGRWESQIEKLEPSLRAGPLFILGQGYLVRQNFDMAAATFLKVPLVHDSEHWVSAQCLLDAGRSLARIGMRGDAAKLYSEILDRYSYAAVATEAREELDQLATKN
jgi:tetratricopeptide (TPR) repeat protein